MDDRPLPALYRIARSVEDDDRLEAPARSAAAVVSRLIPEGPVRRTLGGRWLGHALHPMLTDFPLGSWMSASLLDIIGGYRSRTASRRLLTFGLATAVPTVAAGWNDWLSASPRQRRVGIVHAGINTTAFALYGASLAARRRDRHGIGVALGITGGVAATVGGFFGGHLSLARDTGMRSTSAALCGHRASPSSGEDPPEDASDRPEGGPCPDSGG